MINRLVAGTFPKEDIEDKCDDVMYIVEVLDAEGYVIDPLEAYRAWYLSGDGFWDDPRDFDESDVIIEILSECSLIQIPETPWEDPEFMAFIDKETDNYEPKHHARLEGEKYFTESDWSEFDSADALGA